MKLETELFSGPGWAGPVPAPSVKSPGGDVDVLEAESPPLARALQRLIDDLPEQVALLDENCTIVAVNRAWTEAMATYGYTGVTPGDDYRAVCEHHAATGYEAAIRAAAALDDILTGRRNFFRMSFKGRGEWKDHEYQLSFHRVAVGAQSFITITRSEVTELVELRRIKNDFTKSLIEGQAVERQRIGRELHDSTAQVLTALGLVLARLKRESQSTEWLSTVSELQELVAEAQREIRSVTYLASPPALTKMSFIDALRELVVGFERRTGIATSLDGPSESIPLSELVEGALYRIAQEGLSNVYRHSHATNANVSIAVRGGFAHLSVSDNGIGISAETLAGRGSPGVGLTGMRSRLTEIGGRLSVRRLTPGTAIIASIRLHRN